jgi:lipoprotein signal peptidase
LLIFDFIYPVLSVVGFITLATIVAFLNFPPTETQIANTASGKNAVASIDYLGSLLLFIGVACIITPIQLGGSVWEWNSPQTIGMMIGAVPLLAAFVYVEAKVASDPIIPPNLFINRSVPALLGIAFFLGATFISSIYYISLFFQISYGDSATTAGIKTFPLVLGLVICSIGSGQLVSRTGKYTIFLYVGSAITILAVVLLSTLNASSGTWQQILYLFVAGVGIGNLIQIRVLAIQASVRAEQIAVATAVSQFCQSLGGTVGIAITGTIFNNVFNNNLESYTYFQSVLQKLNITDTSAVIVLRPVFEKPGFEQALKELIESFEGAFQVAYRWILPFAVCLLVLTLFVQQMVLKAPTPSEEDQEKDKEEVGRGTPVDVSGEVTVTDLQDVALDDGAAPTKA